MSILFNSFFFLQFIETYFLLYFSQELGFCVHVKHPHKVNVILCCLMYVMQTSSLLILRQDALLFTESDVSVGNSSFALYFTDAQTNQPFFNNVMFTFEVKFLHFCL